LDETTTVASVAYPALTMHAPSASKTITAKCSKNKNQAHIAHQAEMQVAAALAPFVTAYTPVNPSAVEEYTTAPSGILLDSAASKP
jgi:hypothetical protein